jgi:nitrogen regulatory protein P-II 1
MKKVEAMIRPEKMDAVWEALEETGYPGITVTEITGHGMQKGTLQQWKGARYKLEFLPKIKLELICKDEDVDRIVDAILESATTGMLGDGKIFIYDVAEAVRIRTRERGISALL